MRKHYQQRSGENGCGGSFKIQICLGKGLALPKSFTQLKCALSGIRVLWPLVLLAERATPPAQKSDRKDRGKKLGPPYTSSVLLCCTALITVSNRCCCSTLTVRQSFNQSRRLIDGRPASPTHTSQSIVIDNQAQLICHYPSWGGHREPSHLAAH